MADPITQPQLSALERAIDSVFGKLGIDVDFTKHFLDRVNDERNVRQITIRELGELFAKEYRKWGKHISGMPVDAEAVMKDLSSAINIPFVLNPDGKGKELVAKTVMRKKNFYSPDPALPVESIQEDTGEWTFKGSGRGVSTWVNSNDETVDVATWTDYKKSSRGVRDPNGTKWKLQIRENNREVFYKVVSRAEYTEARDKKAAAVKMAIKFLQKNYGIDAYEQLWMAGGLPKPGSMAEDVTTGSQVRGSEPTPKKRRPTSGGETPHPLRGRLVGEDFDQPPLDVTTPTISQVAQKHGMPEEELVDQLEMGMRVEMEHTSDMQAAMEIALDHLNEFPDYYTRLASVETGGYTPESVGAAWESFRDLDERIMDPREAILRKALEFMDQRVRASGGRKVPLGSIAFDVFREINLGAVASARELAQLYRDWRGDTAIAEGWMESNLYYLDEVTMPERTRKKKSRK